MFCWSFDYDDGDCADPAPGDPCHCVTDPSRAPTADLNYPPGAAPTVHERCVRIIHEHYGDDSCFVLFDCPEMLWDLGACVELGETCELDDGTSGIHACGGACVADTRGDDICDAAFKCADADWDEGDCTVPSPGDACEIGGERGIFDCTLECRFGLGLRFGAWLGDGRCRCSSFSCSDTDYDMGDCPVPVGARVRLSRLTAYRDDGVVSCDGVCLEDTTELAICTCFGASYDLGSVLGEAVASRDSRGHAHLVRRRGELLWRRGCVRDRLRLDRPVNG